MIINQVLNIIKHRNLKEINWGCTEYFWVFGVLGQIFGLTEYKNIQCNM